MELNDETFPKDTGILPESKFPLSPRNCRDAIFWKCGITPERAFIWRSTQTSFDEFLNILAGIFPDSLFRERISTLSDELFRKESGITPLKLFIERLTYLTGAAIPNDGGMLP
uniref:Uncharacterized protein n=1 Tax=Arundo donax TaxID=35708 RepID=A0A0A9A615_ARUDO